MIQQIFKLSTVAAVTLFLAACSEDSTSAKNADDTKSSSSDILNGSSEKLQSSEQKNSSSIIKSSSSSKPKEESSSSSEVKIGTLIGSCNKPFSAKDESINGSFCNEIWTADPISADALESLIANQKEDFGLVCNSNGTSTFEIKKKCAITNALVGCQLDEAQEHEEGIPATITRIYSIANDNESKVMLTSYHNTLEKQTDSPCPAAESQPQTVILDNREAPSGELGCDISAAVGESGELGHVCLETLDPTVSSTMCSLYTSQGLAAKLVANCSSGSVKTCENEDIKVLYYDKDKAPSSCE